MAVLQAAMQPFSSSAMNRLELGALVTAFVTFDAGLFLGSPTASETAKSFVNATVFIANVVFLGSAAAVMIGSKLFGRCKSSEMHRQAVMLQSKYAQAKRKHERIKTKQKLVGGLDSDRVNLAIAGVKARALLRGSKGKDKGRAAQERGNGPVRTGPGSPVGRTHRGRRSFGRSM